MTDFLGGVSRDAAFSNVATRDLAAQSAYTRSARIQIPQGAGEGLVLTSDAVGVGSWQAGGPALPDIIVVDSDTPLQLTVNDSGARIYLDASDGTSLTPDRFVVLPQETEFGVPLPDGITFDIFCKARATAASPVTITGTGNTSPPSGYNIQYTIISALANNSTSSENGSSAEYVFTQNAAGVSRLNVTLMGGSWILTGIVMLNSILV